MIELVGSVSVFINGMMFAAFYAVFSWGMIEFLNLQARLFFSEVSDAKMIASLKSEKTLIAARRFLYLGSLFAFLMGITFANPALRILFSAFLAIQFIAYVIWFGCACYKLNNQRGDDDH